MTDSNVNVSDLITRLQTMGRSIYGERGWQKPTAEATNISQPMISKMINGSVTPSEEMKERLSLGVMILEQIRSGALTTEAEMVEQVLENVEVRLAVLRDQNPILAHIEESFELAHGYVNGAILGVSTAVIISGPPGVGKTYSIIRQILKSGVPHDVISGACTAPGLIRALYVLRKGGVLLIADCDDVTGDETTLNILKAALNSENRFISYRKSAPWLFDGTEEDYEAKKAELLSKIEGEKEESNSDDEYVSREAQLLMELARLEEKIPNRFNFNGSVIFITNKDFYADIERGSKDAKHLEALLDRAVYLDLDMSTPEYLRARVVQGIEDFDILGKIKGMTDEGRVAVKNFINENYEKLARISFRTAEKIGADYVSGPLWKRAAARTQFKRGMK